jgi:hypothetical protein
VENLFYNYINRASRKGCNMRKIRCIEYGQIIALIDNEGNIIIQCHHAKKPDEKGYRKGKNKEKESVKDGRPER